MDASPDLALTVLEGFISLVDYERDNAPADSASRRRVAGSFTCRFE